LLRAAPLRLSIPPICPPSQPPEARTRRKAPAKRAKTSGRGTASQPVELEESQQLPPRLSPRKALAIASSQATEERLFESQLRDMVPEDAPIEPSKAATEASTEESDRAFEHFDARFADNFKGVN